MARRARRTEAIPRYARPRGLRDQHPPGNDRRGRPRHRVADADPQPVARGAAGPDGARPILIQEAGDDWIIYNSNTAWLAVAVGADMTCSLRADAPQTLCHFRGMGHDLVNLAAPQAQAHEF